MWPFLGPIQNKWLMFSPIDIYLFSKNQIHIDTYFHANVVMFPLGTMQVLVFILEGLLKQL